MQSSGKGSQSWLGTQSTGEGDWVSLFFPQQLQVSITPGWAGGRSSAARAQGQEITLAVGDLWAWVGGDRGAGRGLPRAGGSADPWAGKGSLLLPCAWVPIGRCSSGEGWEMAATEEMPALSRGAALL